MHQEYLVARPDETVDQVTRDMVVHNIENIAVVDGDDKPIGVACATDILRLRRWVIEEEGIGHPSVRLKGSLPRVANATSSGHA